MISHTPVTCLLLENLNGHFGEPFLVFVPSVRERNGIWSLEVTRNSPEEENNTDHHCRSDSLSDLIRSDDGFEKKKHLRRVNLHIDRFFDNSVHEEKMPERYMQVVVTGTGASGVLVSFLRIFTKDVYPLCQW